ncbi:hypothetical protein ILUMI_24193 [Ignelater luminosus]|uniref:Uncharacterized protein n=1 Tax=Ignelater luminosus TaxID=2038154 RepID=A0A8K0C7H1_IGNLU|nr:hypothetical protein ILUMI_24193 [Ignelater luminosus]
MDEEINDDIVLQRTGIQNQEEIMDLDKNLSCCKVKENLDKDIVAEMEERLREAENLDSDSEKEPESTPVSLPEARNCIKKKKTPTEVLQQAAEDVKQHRPSLRQAAEVYSLNFITLFWYVKTLKCGMPNLKIKTGYAKSRLFFSDTQEKELIEHN